MCRFPKQVNTSKEIQCSDACIIPPMHYRYLIAHIHLYVTVRFRWSHHLTPQITVRSDIAVNSNSKSFSWLVCRGPWSHGSWFWGTLVDRLGCNITLSRSRPSRHPTCTWLLTTEPSPYHLLLPLQTCTFTTCPGFLRSYFDFPASFGSC